MTNSISDIIFMVWDMMELAPKHYTIITNLFPLLEMQVKMTSLVTEYDAIGCFDTLKYDIASRLLFGVHVLLCFCNRCGGDTFYRLIFFVSGQDVPWWWPWMYQGTW